VQYKQSLSLFLPNNSYVTNEYCNNQQVQKKSSSQLGHYAIIIQVDHFFSSPMFVREEESSKIKKAGFTIRFFMQPQIHHSSMLHHAEYAMTLQHPGLACFYTLCYCYASKLFSTQCH